MISMNRDVQMQKMISLRCNHCGAPLDVLDHDSEFIRCSSCGTTQKMVDAKAFLEQIMLQVYSWVKISLPKGYNISGSEQVDPIARHAIFNNQIRPSLESEYSHYLFAFHRIMAQSLLNLPFNSNTDIQTSHESVQIFEFNLKIQSIKPLICDEEDGKSIINMDNLSLSFAYILNSIRLLQEHTPERYELLAANYFTAAESVRNNIEYRSLYLRFLGISQANLAIHLLMDRNYTDAKKTIDDSIISLEEGEKAIKQNHSLALMVQAIKKELLTAQIIRKIILASGEDPSGNPLNTLSIIEKIMRELKVHEQYDSGHWKGIFKDLGRYYQVFTMFEKIRRAQNGRGSIRFLSGPGSYLIPFWVVDLPYSFRTGILWNTKGKEAKETIFVSSTFSTDPDSLSFKLSWILTDVFMKRHNSGFLYDFISNIFGTEESISCGDNILKDIAQKTSLKMVGNQKVIPPMTSKKEVEKIVHLYITRILESNQNLHNKFGLSAPRITGLIFIPGEIHDSGFQLNLDIGLLKPLSIGDVSKLQYLAM